MSGTVCAARTLFTSSQKSGVPERHLTSTLACHPADTQATNRTQPWPPVGPARLARLHSSQSSQARAPFTPYAIRAELGSESQCLESDFSRRPTGQLGRIWMYTLPTHHAVTPTSPAATAIPPAFGAVTSTPGARRTYAPRPAARDPRPARRVSNRTTALESIGTSREQH